MSMRVGHMQDGNASKTHVICQCEWDTFKMTIGIPTRGTQANWKCEWDTCKMSMNI